MAWVAVESVRSCRIGHLPIQVALQAALDGVEHAHLGMTGVTAVQVVSDPDDGVQEQAPALIVEAATAVPAGVHGRIDPPSGDTRQRSQCSADADAGPPSTHPVQRRGDDVRVGDGGHGVSQARSAPERSIRQDQPAVPDFLVAGHGGTICLLLRHSGR